MIKPREVKFEGRPLLRLELAAQQAGYSEVEDVVRIGAAMFVTFMDCAAAGYTQVLFRNPTTKGCRSLVILVLGRGKDA